MAEFLDRLTAFLFGLLFFLTPLILWPSTSELFEFNKMVFVYTLTISIVAVWLSKCLIARKIIFRRTILDLPLLIFLGSQILSTVFSTDYRTSIFGYYSRFNGGLLSTLCYLLLYWAYVSNMDKAKTQKTIAYCLVPSALVVSLYGVLEHFGIDKNIWVQDVQNRVFSTLGQPNWLAAYLVALAPLTWGLALNEKIKNQSLKLQFKNKKFWLWFGLSITFFITLLFTKSRSGILGYIFATPIFWAATGFTWIRAKYKIFEFLFVTLIFNISFLILTILIGTPWTPSIQQRVNRQATTARPAGPALETGGTESGAIRKIVWQGAIDIWKHYPLFGSGVETFAFSYYQFRPKEHNLVSEWDFLYNKAHNEYLNFMATTGTLGTFSYFLVIFFSLIQISKSKNIALLAGYFSILVTNFFGFSVVPVALLFFLFPAFSVCLNYDEELNINKKIKLSGSQKTALGILFLVISYSLFVIGQYWYADVLFNKGRQLNQQGNYALAFRSLQKAIAISPNEGLYHNEISQTAAKLAALNSQFIDLAIKESDRAITLSPSNVNFLRNRATMFLKLAEINPGYLADAKETLERAAVKAPTDAKIFYNLALTDLRIGKIDEAIAILEKAINLKPNYKEARFAYALVLKDKGEVKKAKEELVYILAKIDPNDKLTQEELKKL